MKLVCFIFSFFFFSTLYAQNPLDTIDKDYPFEDLFPEDLYDLKKVHQCDFIVLDGDKHYTLKFKPSDYAEACFKHKNLAELTIDQFRNIFDKNYKRLSKPELIEDPKIGSEIEYPEDKEKTLTKKMIRLKQRKFNTLYQKFFLPATRHLEALTPKYIRNFFIALVSGANSGARDGAMTLSVTKDPFFTVAAILFSPFMNGINFFLKESPEKKAYLTALNDARSKVVNVLSKLKNEKVLPLEKKYLSQQHKYTAHNRKIIEETLLAVRNDFKIRRDKTNLVFAQELLSLPIDIKNIPQINALDMNLRLKGGEHFGWYSGEIQQDLLFLLNKIARASQTKEGLVIVLHGPPSTGKSAAARLLAKAAGLQSYLIDINSPQDYSQNALYGTDGHRAMQGHYVRAFLGLEEDDSDTDDDDADEENDEQEQAKKLYINLALILDDPDRAAQQDDNGQITDRNGFIGSMMSFTDPHKKIFSAKYYNNFSLRIEPVIKIITTNVDMGRFEDVPQFAALRSRFRDNIIYFPLSENPDEQKNTIREYLNDALFNNSLACRSTSPQQREVLRRDIADFIVENYNIADVRIMQDRAGNLLNVPRGNNNQGWINYAQRRRWREAAPGN